MASARRSPSIQANTATVRTSGHPLGLRFDREGPVASRKRARYDDASLGLDRGEPRHLASDLVERAAPRKADAQHVSRAVGSVDAEHAVPVVGDQLDRGRRQVVPLQGALRESHAAAQRVIGRQVAERAATPLTTRSSRPIARRGQDRVRGGDVLHADAGEIADGELVLVGTTRARPAQIAPELHGPFGLVRGVLQLAQREHCSRESTTSRSARRRISGSSSCLPTPSEPTAVTCAPGSSHAAWSSGSGRRCR